MKYHANLQVFPSLGYTVRPSSKLGREIASLINI